MITMASKDILSAFGAVFKGLRNALTRTGVNVGGTADYPRVEIHSIVESEWLDKGWLKRITCVVECMSDKRIADVVDMNKENLHRMLEKGMVLDEGWQIVGVVAGQAQELSETTDTKAIIYRLLQNMTIYVERVNE
jgi:hypothetical protein